MAVAYIKSLVQLNLGADDAAFEHAIEVKEDEGVDASVVEGANECVVIDCDSGSFL